MPQQSPRAATTGPRDQRKRPGDLTGVRGQQLAAKREADKEDALAAAAAVHAQERIEKIHTVVDYTEHGLIEEDVLTDEPVEAHPDHMIIRVNYPIEDMTFGREVITDAVLGEHGEVIKPAVLGRLNTYNFEEGVQYKVPWELGLHLKRLGYVYDF
jgi:hypothetical protein